VLAGRFLLNAQSETAPMTPETSCIRHHGYLPSHEGEDLAGVMAWVRAGRWLAAWDWAWGAPTRIFSLTWRFLGEYQGVAGCHRGGVDPGSAWLGRRLLSGAVGGLRLLQNLANQVCRDSRHYRPLVVMLIALAKFALLASLPVGTWLSSDNAWDGLSLSPGCVFCVHRRSTAVDSHAFLGTMGDDPGGLDWSAGAGGVARYADRVARLLPAVLGQWLDGAC
jgi:hypothetical protein